jgi:hypothetical protein
LKRELARHASASSFMLPAICSKHHAFLAATDAAIPTQQVQKHKLNNEKALTLECRRIIDGPQGTKRNAFPTKNWRFLQKRPFIRALNYFEDLAVGEFWAIQRHFPQRVEIIPDSERILIWHSCGFNVPMVYFLMSEASASLELTYETHIHIQ